MVRLNRVPTMLFAVAFLSLAFTANAQLVGTSSIRAPAVILQNNTGSLTMVNVTVETGNGSVFVTGPNTTAQSTLQSAQNASTAASHYLGLDPSNYNFTYYISDASNVSGPSAGTAMALLAISALSHRQLNQNFTVTGTISTNGVVGQIGGVYDKVAAAGKSRTISFILVPKVDSTSFEDELYLIAQASFSIPVVQVANLTEAAGFAFGSANALSSMTSFQLYSDYKVGALPNASLICSNSCDGPAFSGLANFTFNYTKDEIGKLNSQQGLADVSAQLSMQLNQSEGLARKGYLYVGANIAFLDYINAFMFSHRSDTITQGFSKLQSISNYCSMLTAPQATAQNYEYVIAGQLRQQWGTYTANTALSSYNATAVDSDGVIESMYSAAQANAWCNSAQYMYQKAAQPGTPLLQSAALQQTASSRINRASNTGLNLYTAAASSFYNNRNYAAAIIAADYAYALYGTMPANLSAKSLLSLSESTAANSTYGIWPEQFANEALFYAQEANAASNSTQALGYAQQAYLTALLAHEVSNDTSVISQNLLAPIGQPTTSIPAGQPSSGNQAAVPPMLINLLLLLVIITIIILVFVIMIAVQLSRLNMRASARKRR